MTGRDMLIALSIVHKGNTKEITNAIRERKALQGEAERLAEHWSDEVRCKAVTFIDPEYPKSLKKSPNPPLVLFYYGDLSLIQDENKCVSYIGSRDVSKATESTTREICEDLAKRGITIVSGLSKGVDTYACESACKSGKSVAVLGCGIDYHYPQENSLLQDEIAKNGLVISEYPPNTEPRPENFPMRSRIIAALSKLMVVGESKKQSGAIIAVGQALSMGKDICCLPQEIGSFNNYLIKEGAAMVENADDIMLELSNGIR